MLFLSVSCQPRLAERLVLFSRSWLLADTATTLSRVDVRSLEGPTPGHTHPIPSQNMWCCPSAGPTVPHEPGRRPTSPLPFSGLPQGTRHRRMSSKDVSPLIYTIHQRDKVNNIYLRSASRRPRCARRGHAAALQCCPEIPSVCPSWGPVSRPKYPAPACGVRACTEQWHKGAGLPRGLLGVEISPGQEAAGAVLVQSVVQSVAQLLLSSPAGPGSTPGPPQWGGDSGDVPRAWCAVWVRRDWGGAGGGRGKGWAARTPPCAQRHHRWPVLGGGDLQAGESCSVYQQAAAESPWLGRGVPCHCRDIWGTRIAPCWRGHLRQGTGFGGASGPYGPAVPPAAAQLAEQQLSLTSLILMQSLLISIYYFLFLKGSGAQKENNSNADGSNKGGRAGG